MYRLKWKSGTCNTVFTKLLRHFLDSFIDFLKSLAPPNYLLPVIRKIKSSCEQLMDESILVTLFENESFCENEFDYREMYL